MNGGIAASASGGGLPRPPLPGPHAPQRRRRRPWTMTTPQPAGATPPVLVVDDHRDSADALAQLVALWGHRALVAYDGASALALYREHRPGVVVLDIGMPGMDGCELTSRIRRDYPGDRALVVAVTGYGREEDRRRCAEAGADRHLTKPADPGELRRLLDGAAGGPPA